MDIKEIKLMIVLTMDLYQIVCFILLKKEECKLTHVK